MNQKKISEKLMALKIFYFCPVSNDQRPRMDFFKKKKGENTNFFFKFFSYSIMWDLRNKLSQPTLLYEEGSWYNFEVWEKDFNLLKKDKLITFKLFKN